METVCTHWNIDVKSPARAKNALEDKDEGGGHGRIWGTARDTVFMWVLQTEPSPSRFQGKLRIK